MTSLFDGLSGLLAGVFGAVVRYEPQNSIDARDIQSIFREQPIEVQGADGQNVLIDAPTWRVERNRVPEVRRGDHLRLGDGRRFRITTTHNSGSPSVDAFVICEVQEIS